MLEKSQSEHPAALELVGITKRFPGIVACDDISLSVAPGEVLGLLGENGAGKSTLMNVVYGLYRPDEGHVEIGGRKVDIDSPQRAVCLGIGMVHQHFMLVPDMTVAENIALGPSRTPGRARLSEVESRARDLSSRFGLEIDPRAWVEELSVGEQQRVEILKMLYRGAQILILDEPTAALNPQEWRDLAEFLQRLVADGAAVILITHKLNELFGVADRCAILRDGVVVDTVDMTTADNRSLARSMVGREVSLRAERPELAPLDTVLTVENVSIVHEESPLLRDISFEIRAHEVLGIAGVAGNGQEELVEVLTGVRAPTTGTIQLAGVDIAGKGARAFMDSGGAHVPEDRHRDAVALGMTFWENVVMKEIGQTEMTHRGVIDRVRAREVAEELVAHYDVKTRGVDITIGQLSGGNQQKVVFGREMRRDPRLLIACQPTRGLDIGAMEFVYVRINEHKRGGGATLLISSELDEVLTLSDRIAVISDGAIARILSAAEATPETVGLLMAGGGRARA